MRAAIIIRYVGMVLLLDALFMFISALIAFFNGMDTGFYPLLLSFVITTIVGVFPMIFVPKDKHLTSRDGYIIVIASWIASCAMGMLPYLIWGGEFSLSSAWFESTSGFTTTGSTVLQDVEALPRSLLFWRASTHWIGGVGVVLFALVVLPSVGRQKMTLSSVELSPLAKDNFRFNTKKILKVILLVYIGLTAAETVLLNLVGMDWFDAVAQSFSTVATGGFSTKNASIAAFNSLSVEIIIMTFMLFSGMHFGLIYSTIRGRGLSLWKSEVSRYYVIIMVGCGIFVALNLLTWGVYDNFGDAIRYSIFQCLSYGTTTGFATTDTLHWPSFAMLVLIFLSIQCAMAGSTSGGMKVDRVMLLFKAIRLRVLKLQHPSAVMRIKLSGHMQDEQAVSAAVLLVAFYMLTLLVSTAVMSVCGFDLLTSFSSSVASLGNVGPGLGQASSMSNMSFLPSGLKYWLSFVMLFGRLELFGLIHLFMMRSWK